MPVEPEPEHGMPPRRCSPPLLALVKGVWENPKLARKDGPSSMVALLPLR